MTKQKREAQIEFYIYNLGIMNFDFGQGFLDLQDRIFKLEKRAKRELTRPINEGEK